tara:strand:+ start:311 stop:544 length:234 start_codon:yes stop_codon:yes gene_type:complete
MNPLTFFKGKLTSLGIGMALVGPFAQNVLNITNGAEWVNLAAAATGPVASWPVLLGAGLALFGSIRRQMGYKIKRKR